MMRMQKCLFTVSYNFKIRKPRSLTHMNQTQKRWTWNFFLFFFNSLMGFALVLRIFSCIGPREINVPCHFVLNSTYYWYIKNETPCCTASHAITVVATKYLSFFRVLFFSAFLHLLIYMYYIFAHRLIRIKDKSKNVKKMKTEIWNGKKRKIE